MIIQLIKNFYNTFIEEIKKCNNRKARLEKIVLLIKQILDLKIKIPKLQLANLLGISRPFLDKCIKIAKGELNSFLSIETRGRKKITEIFPDLKNDLEEIINNNTFTDPHFETEKQYVELTLDVIMEKLINRDKYKFKHPGRSTVADLLNIMDYKLKTVKRVKPLKKIEKTDTIFENVNKKKDDALQDENTGLISIDTKDKVLIGPYSRKGKSRILVEAVDHELTNRCLTPFGILDIKNNQPYFYNFINKPTSSAIVDCIDDYLSDKNYKKLVILLDNGPDNSGCRTAFIKGLIDLSIKHNIEIELVYYPPYHSKYNPVERLWSRLERIWNGFLLNTEEICNNFMRNLTWKGNKAKVKFITKEYEKGIKYSKKYMTELEDKHVKRNKDIPKYSLIISPKHA